MNLMRKLCSTRQQHEISEGIFLLVLIVASGVFALTIKAELWWATAVCLVTMIVAILCIAAMRTLVWDELRLEQMKRLTDPHT